MSGYLKRSFFFIPGIIIMIWSVRYLLRPTSLLNLPHRYVLFAQLTGKLQQAFAGAYDSLNRWETDHEKVIDLDERNDLVIEHKDGIAGFSEWKRYFTVNGKRYRLNWSDTRNKDAGPYILYKDQLYFIWQKKSASIDQARILQEQFIVFDLKQ